jgi:lipoprotein-releasing system ATP-binding protein
MDIIIIDNITKSYRETSGERFVVFKNFSLAIKKGEFVAITGESGSGKTTLMNIIGCIDDIDDGKIIIDGTDVTSLDEDELAKFRNQKIGYIFQNHYLLRGFNVLENVLIPSIIKGYFFEKEYIKKAEELLKTLGIGEKLHREITQISGGERQRVAIARALINSPEIIVADEPTGNLDPKNSEIIFNLFYNLVKELGKTCIVATHNLNLAKKADRIIDLSPQEVRIRELSENSTY